MDIRDRLLERVEALEHQTEMLMQYTRTVERLLRWWRGTACGLVMLNLLSLALSYGKAADAPAGGMAGCVATREDKLTARAFDAAANEVVITGANLRIVNGLNATNTTNGLGNLIVGYNESREGDPLCPSNVIVCEDLRTGSHNVVVGRGHNFSRFGGVVVGLFNTISDDFASVSGGLQNTASGNGASVSGGLQNTADSPFASVSGGLGNRASGAGSSISGGTMNRTLTVAGAVIEVSSVSGGANRTAPGEDDWAAGALFSDM